MKKSLFPILMLSAILMFMGCEPEITPVIALDKNTLSIKPGETHVLVATINPADASAIVEWTSSKPEVATIDANGQITAITVGVTTITASSENAESAQCVVTVIDDRILFESNEIEMNIYDTLQLVAILPEWESAAQVTWVSSDSLIATINNNGIVEAIAEGTTTITASAEGLKSAQCTITVINNIPSSFPRKFVVEHFTGDGCGYCPGGMYAIEDYIVNSNPSAIWISHHYGYNTDEYTISESSRIGKMLGVQGAPNMALNRTKQMGTSIGFHPGYLPEITIADDTVAEASVVINHSYNAETHQLDVTVSGQVANTDVKSYLLTVIIKENRLVGKQADYTYSWKTSPWKEYMHARVIRDVVSADAFGDTVYVEKQAYSKTLSYTINEDWVAENCCVVAYLTPTNKKPIINAEQAPLIAGTTGGEQYYPYGITESQAPNTPEKITFDSIAFNKPADDKLEVVLYSQKSIRSSIYGAMKPILVLDFNTTANTLVADTLDIQDDNAENTFTAGYCIDESCSFGGSRYQYVDSKELAQGNIVAYHTWKLKSGKIAYNADGSILMAGNFDNGKHFTMTYTPVASSVEE